MRARTITRIRILGLAAALWSLCASIAVANDAKMLQDLVSKVQRRPSDQELRKKIIQLVAGMNPKPAVPLEAVEHEGAAEYKFKNAKSADDFVQAAAEYDKALLIAPWVAADYYNEGFAWEKAGQPANAVSAYELYLIAAPQADDATEVAKRMGALRASAQGPSPVSGAALDDDTAFIKRLDGAVYEKRWKEGTTTLTIKGNVVVLEDDPNSRAPGPGFTRKLYDVVGRKFVQARDPSLCDDAFQTRNCYGEATITEKEISIQSVADGHPLGQRTAFDITYKRVKKR